MKPAYLYCEHLTPGDFASYGMGFPVGAVYVLICRECTEHHARNARVGLFMTASGQPRLMEAL